MTIVGPWPQRPLYTGDTLVAPPLPNVRTLCAWDVQRLNPEEQGAETLTRELGWSGGSKNLAQDGVWRESGAAKAPVKETWEASGKRLKYDCHWSRLAAP